MRRLQCHVHASTCELRLAPHYALHVSSIITLHTSCTYVFVMRAHTVTHTVKHEVTTINGQSMSIMGNDRQCYKSVCAYRTAEGEPREACATKKENYYVMQLEILINSYIWSIRPNVGCTFYAMPSLIG